MESANELWTLVREEIRKNLVEVIFNVWIKNINILSFDGITAVLIIDDFRAKIVEQKFLPLIKEAFLTVTGLEVEVAFVSAAEESASDAPEGEDEEENTFDTFVVGHSNRFAHAAAKAVAEKPGISSNYNPLFIYGSSGLGKTHLLRAIGDEVLKKNPNANIIYTRGEDFVNLIIAGIREHQMDAIREKYRKADVLLVDDIQFISGKESTQEEFFHTFDTLIGEHRQIVLTSDRPPKDMTILDERLRTRFEWGLLADIQPPDLETRIAIIHRKAQALDFELPNPVVQFIADNIKNNVRQIEGVVKRIKAFVTIQGAAITLETAEEALRDILSSGTPIPVKVEKIISETARTHGVLAEDLRGKKRDARTAEARQIAMYIVRDMTNLSTTEIGKEFGGRDHTTVLHAVNKVAEKRANDSTMRTTIEDIMKNVEG